VSGKTAVILANGDLGDPQRLLARLATIQPDLVIAADGGARHAPGLELRLDVVIGDLDSGAGDLGVEVLRHPPDKDETDLELALVHALTWGAETVILLGAVGGRLDMTLANALLLLHPSVGHQHVAIWHGSETAYALRPPGGVIRGRAGDRVSLIPLAGDALGVTTEGLQFGLHGERLAPGPARGLSNRMTAASAEVRMEAGTLLMIHAPNEP
jgi:thiamine pyrophosphokinase